MLFIRLLPVILAALLFAAHLTRHFGLMAALPVLALLGTLFIYQPLIIRIWQILVSVAVMEWIRITFAFVWMRQALEQPYGRLVVIMVAVILFNIFTIIWLENKKIKAAYHFNS